jgi:hypothetical protein
MDRPESPLELSMTPEDAVAKWQAIYEQSLAMIDPTPDDYWQSAGQLDSDDMPSWRTMCDLRTVHMGGGRQNYKNLWVREFMVANPKAIVVECNAGLRDMTVQLERPWRRSVAHVHHHGHRIYLQSFL